MISVDTPKIVTEKKLMRHKMGQKYKNANEMVFIVEKVMYLTGVDYIFASNEHPKI